MMHVLITFTHGGTRALTAKDIRVGGYRDDKVIFDYGSSEDFSDLEFCQDEILKMEVIFK